MMRASLALAFVLAFVSVLALAACPHPHQSAHTAAVFFRGDLVAHVTDTVDAHHVVRREELGSTGETITSDVALDDRGLALAGRYQRNDKRTVTLAADHAGTYLADGSGARLPLAHNALVIDLLRYANPPQPLDVDLVDLSSGDAIVGKVLRRGAEVVALDAHGAVVARANVEGARTGPGAFSEGDSAAHLDAAPTSPPFALPRGVADDGSDDQAKALATVRGVRLLGVEDVAPALELDGPGQERDPAPGSVALLFGPYD
ncbi:MAG TPA: hypothetical protein VGO62_09120, partial [Myxococcota bacterium]